MQSGAALGGRVFGGGGGPIETEPVLEHLERLRENWMDGWMEDKQTQHQRYLRDVREVGAATAFSWMKRPISANGAESADLPNALNSFFLALRGQLEGNPWTSVKYCDSPGTEGRWRRRTLNYCAHQLREVVSKLSHVC